MCYHIEHDRTLTMVAFNHCACPSDGYHLGHGRLSTLIVLIAIVHVLKLAGCKDVGIVLHTSNRHELESIVC